MISRRTGDTLEQRSFNFYIVVNHSESYLMVVHSLSLFVKVSVFQGIQTKHLIMVIRSRRSIFVFSWISLDLNGKRSRLVEIL